MEYYCDPWECYFPLIFHVPWSLSCVAGLHIWSNGYFFQSLLIDPFKLSSLGFLWLQCYAGISPRKGSAQKILSHVWVCAQVNTVQVFFPTGAREIWHVHYLLWFHSLYLGLSAYYWTLRWVRLLPGPLVSGARSHNTHKTLLFVDGYLFHFHFDASIALSSDCVHSSFCMSRNTQMEKQEPSAMWIISS